MLESSDTDTLNRIHELESALRERDELLHKQSSLLQLREQRIRFREEAARAIQNKGGALQPGAESWAQAYVASGDLVEEVTRAC